MSIENKKILLLKGEKKLMCLTETYEQFKNFLRKLCQGWKQYNFEEIFQVANVGLVKAFNSYNADRNIQFITYLSTIVTNELKMYHRKENRHLHNVSLNKTINDEDNIELEDLISDDVSIEEDILKKIEFKEIEMLLEKLNPKKRGIIKKFYLEGMKQQQIADECGLAQSYVSRLLNNSLAELRRLYKRDGGETMSKISREQLLEEVKLHGTDVTAKRIIAKKYETTLSTISTYLSRWKINDELKENKIVEDGNPEVNAANRIESDNREIKPKLKILKQVYRGMIMEYRLEEGICFIYSAEGKGEISLSQDKIDLLIKELQELKNAI